MTPPSSPKASPTTAKEIQDRLKDLADPEIAVHSSRFFKTGKGQYGQGDRFVGIRVPVLRTQVNKFKDISLKQIRILLHSPFHEERLLALLLLVKQYEKGDHPHRSEIYKFYLSSTTYINNWDLVDTSAPHIVGAYLFDRSRARLYKLATSRLLWDRRIAIMATFYMIRKNDFTDTLGIAKKLINDPEDLIHKAVGWMLREIGNRAPGVEKEFLASRYKKMPRTMLRYAVEKFPEKERQKYLKGLI